MKLSVIIPVFNEERWIEAVIRRVLGQKIPGVTALEIVVVNDGSTDRTVEIVSNLVREFPDKIGLYSHETNQGKGAAVKTAAGKMSGQICVVQDADLEYDPADYPLLLGPIIDGRADCVFGSRFSGTQAKRVLYYWHYVGNRFLTLLSNAMTNINLTDMETGFKAFKASVLKGMNLHSRTFDFEPEITAKVARGKYRIYEVGISYSGRTYAEGKKVSWRDGVRAVAAILYYAFFD